MEKIDEFIKNVVRILNVTEGSLTLDTKLDEEKLDSLGILALSASIDNIYNVIVPVNKLRQAKTIGEVVDLVKAAADEK